jgi:CheY-like chemotaxis protein
MSLRPRILVASAERAEREAICDWLLSEGIDTVPARALPGALRQMEGAAFDAIIAGVEFAFSEQVKVTRSARQTRAPIIALIADPAGQAAAERAGYLSTNRPIDRDMLMCSVTMALSESRPPRRSVRKAVAMIEAIAEGIPASLVDVSNEGLRLHLRRGHRPLPPVFSVRIPLVGLVLRVQRCWTGTSAPGAPAVSICGAALHDNAAAREQGWRRFVDVVPTRAPD